MWKVFGTVQIVYTGNYEKLDHSRYCCSSTHQVRYRLKACEESDVYYGDYKALIRNYLAEKQRLTEW
jgi:hypothetical protein